MSLATVDKHYHVSSRMLLLKEFSDKGFVFYTNYDSPKALALDSIPKAAMVFWWSTCQRQVRIEGDVIRAPDDQSDAYFQSRPLGSQIAATISRQSQIIRDRDALIKEYEAADNAISSLQHAPLALTRPANWGGYVLIPTLFEFWQGRPHRLHDRFQYSKHDSGWEIVQLAP